MPSGITNHIAEQERDPVNMSRSLQRIFWISITVTLVICLLDIAGWITGITWLKSLGQYWVSMKSVTSLCFVLTSVSLAILLTNRPSAIKRMIPVINRSILNRGKFTDNFQLASS